MKKIVLGADHGGYQLKNIIKHHLVNRGFEVMDFGTNSMDSVDYPNYARLVGDSVMSGEADCGVLVCGTGVGISIAANKIRGIRCALCTNTTMARLTREHNDANVLALGGRIIGDVLAIEIVDAFLGAEFEGGRHAKRVGLISSLEE